MQKDTEVIQGEIKGGTNEDHLLLKGEPVRSLGKRRLKVLVKTHSERKSSRQLRNSDSRSPEDRDLTVR